MTRVSQCPISLRAEHPIYTRMKQAFCVEENKVYTAVKQKYLLESNTRSSNLSVSVTSVRKI
jgi:hypothetical protein